MALATGGWLAVEEVGLLCGVVGLLPSDGDGLPRSVGGSDDWSGHRVYRLILSDDPADVVTASLVRPQGWLDYQPTDAAGRVRLSLPEMGVDGWATVLGVDVCAEVGLLPASGRRVTGVFSHSRGRVVELSLSGEACPLGVTAGHPVWSVDREGWIAAGALLLGERLRAANGSAVTVLGIAASENDESVFNLEVDADHCYRVGEQGILVHNASCTTLYHATSRSRAGKILGLGSYPKKFTPGFRPGPDGVVYLIDDAYLAEGFARAYRYTDEQTRPTRGTTLGFIVDDDLLKSLTYKAKIQNGERDYDDPIDDWQGNAAEEWILKGDNISKWNAAVQAGTIQVFTLDFTF